MIEFNDVMKRVTEILDASRENRRIYNKEVAQALSLTPEYFAVIKKRGKIPYEAIASFCHSRRISINWILFGQQPKELCSKEDESIAV